MATVYGVNRTKILAGAPSSLTPECVFGSVAYIYDEYTFAATASGTIVELGPDLTKGQRIIDWQLDHEALGSAVTLKLGTPSNDDSLMAAAASATAAIKTMAANGVSKSVGLECTGDTTADAEDTKIILTTGGAAATGKAILSMLVAVKN